MAKKRPLAVDDLVTAVGELVDQIKVLVAAVDDLRCEVEWFAQNAADQRFAMQPPSAAPVEHAARSPVDATQQIEHAMTDDVNDPIVDAADAHLVEPPNDDTVSQRLARLERRLMTGPRQSWSFDECDDEPDTIEFPTGQVFALDDGSWEVVLTSRPAHVMHMGCDCEEGVEGPLLFGWAEGDEHFIRELTDGEAAELQQACLAVQQEESAQREENAARQTQLGLWSDPQP